jgi:predicted nucleic acid-binding protein
MNVVDSSGWLEYFAAGSNGPFFLPPIRDTVRLLVPTVCLYEVFKRVLQQYDTSTAHRCINDMHAGKIIELDASLALLAAQISIQHKLAMADSLIYATAQAHHATLWTQDEHFQTLPGVRYIAKPAA